MSIRMLILNENKAMFIRKCSKVPIFNDLIYNLIKKSPREPMKSKSYYTSEFLLFSYAFFLNCC